MYCSMQWLSLRLQLSMKFSHVSTTTWNFQFKIFSLQITWKHFVCALKIPNWFNGSTTSRLVCLITFVLKNMILRIVQFSYRPKIQNYQWTTCADRSWKSKRWGCRIWRIERTAEKNQRRTETNAHHKWWWWLSLIWNPFDFQHFMLNYIRSLYFYFKTIQSIKQFFSHPHGKFYCRIWNIETSALSRNLILQCVMPSHENWIELNLALFFQQLLWWGRQKFGLSIWTFYDDFNFFISLASRYYLIIWCNIWIHNKIDIPNSTQISTISPNFSTK